MPNSAILSAIARPWFEQKKDGDRMLDLSCGKGASARLLSELGYRVVATDYLIPPPLPAGLIESAGGFGCGLRVLWQ